MPPARRPTAPQGAWAGIEGLAVLAGGGGEVAASGRPLTGCVPSGRGSPHGSRRGSRILLRPSRTRRGVGSSRTPSPPNARHRPRLGVDPCADLQMHTTWSDGSLPLEDMVQASRSGTAVRGRHRPLPKPSRSRTDDARRARGAGPRDRRVEPRIRDGDALRVLHDGSICSPTSLDMDDDRSRVSSWYSARSTPSCGRRTDRALPRRPQPAAPARARPPEGPDVRPAGRPRRRLAPGIRRGRKAGEGAGLDATVWRQDLNVELATSRARRASGSRSGATPMRRGSSSSSRSGWRSRRSPGSRASASSTTGRWDSSVDGRIGHKVDRRRSACGQHVPRMRSDVERVLSPLGGQEQGCSKPDHPDDRENDHRGGVGPVREAGDEDGAGDRGAE